MKNTIRNFVIIAHVDHGKSTLADRLLEVTHTVEARRMKAQYLDQLELERERGITIKMAPVRMKYIHGGETYMLNLIDTPGHSDFSYEVSRSLAAVEGAVLLVDVTQGIQAQTLANLRFARKMKLAIVPVVNKVDLIREEGGERLARVVSDVAQLVDTSEEDIVRVSGKTGEGVGELLEHIVRDVPPPQSTVLPKGFRARGLIFDSFYDDHKGVIASVRVREGGIISTDEIYLAVPQEKSKIKEVGFFAPQLTALTGGVKLEEGMMGYVATGIRDPEHIRIGDTLFVVDASVSKDEMQKHTLPGYQDAQPVVFVSFYPEESDEHAQLKKSLDRLRLNDAALSIEPDQNEVLGRGFKVGFLGRLHFEITSERLRREFNMRTVNTFPSVQYKVRVTKDEWRMIVKPEELPQDYLEIWEPMIQTTIMLPSRALAAVLGIQKKFRMNSVLTETVGEQVQLSAQMPLVELVSDFDDQLKSATQGLASFSYTLGEYARADIIRVDILLSGTLLPGLSRFVPRDQLERESRRMVERLKELLPREQFSQPIQASAGGRILSREDIPALRKDVTGYLYGGDRTRKMKLWKKQARGKVRLKERSMNNAKVSPEIFKELLKK